MARNKKHVLRFAAVLLLLSIFILSASDRIVFDGKIEPANDSTYFERLLPRLKEAEKSIYVVMFFASHYPRYPESPTNLFLRELVNARRRGADVRVILNRSEGSYAAHATTENLKTAAYLSSHGVDVYLDNPSQSTHAKLLVIDGTFVVIGSANWSFSAMTRNNEASVIIESPGLAGFYEKYFTELLKQCPAAMKPVEREPDNAAN